MAVYIVRAGDTYLVTKPSGHAGLAWSNAPDAKEKAAKFCCSPDASLTAVYHMELRGRGRGQFVVEELYGS